jgi:hypothetical protein
MCVTFFDIVSYSRFVIHAINAPERVANRISRADRILLCVSVMRH